MTQTPLNHQKCAPCEGGTKPLKKAAYQVYLDSVTGWEVVEHESAITKQVQLKNFSAAISFINKIAELAEAEGHHPDLFLHDYKHVTITLSTHAIKGLSINDFILAAKIDQIDK